MHLKAALSLRKFGADRGADGAVGKTVVKGVSPLAALTVATNRKPAT